MNPRHSGIRVQGHLAQGSSCATPTATCAHVILPGPRLSPSRSPRVPRRVRPLPPCDNTRPHLASSSLACSLGPGQPMEPISRRALSLSLSHSHSKPWFVQLSDGFGTQPLMPYLSCGHELAKGVFTRCRLCCKCSAVQKAFLITYFGVLIMKVSCATPCSLSRGDGREQDRPQSLLRNLQYCGDRQTRSKVENQNAGLEKGS